MYSVIKLITVSHLLDFIVCTVMDSMLFLTFFMNQCTVLALYGFVVLILCTIKRLAVVQSMLTVCSDVLVLKFVCVTLGAHCF